MIAEHVDTLVRLWRHPAASREAIDRFRAAKLRALVAHAAARVPYYRALFSRAGVRADDIREPADLARVPISTKADLRARPLGDVVAAGVDPTRLILRYTAGSTGEPTRVRRTRREDHLLQAFRLRAEWMLGRRLRDRRVSVTSRGVPTDRRPRGFERWRAELGILPAWHVDCLQSIDGVAREIARLAPDVLGGYPGVLTEVASRWRHLDERPVDPRLVLVGGEVVTPAMRERIHAGFGAPVFASYGSHEFNLLGWECPVTGDLHVCDDAVVLEVLRDGRPVSVGESGEVVVTGLHSYAVPYIRYRLGDTATRGDDTCRCGAPFSTLRGVRGREMDYCVLPGGRKIHHWEVIPMTFWDMPWHRRYQLVQEAHERFVLRVTADVEPPRADVEALSRAIRQTLGPDVEFRLERVDDMAFAESGKHRLCYSPVARGDGGAGESARDGV
jgi:phenylacetate-CoA ligase